MNFLKSHKIFEHNKNLVRVRFLTTMYQKSSKVVCPSWVQSWSACGRFSFIHVRQAYFSSGAMRSVSS